MRAYLVVVLGGCLSAGCGDTIGERVANSPEVQQRLIEIEKRRQADLEEQKKQLDEIRTSTRAPEEFQTGSRSSVVQQPPTDAADKTASTQVPLKTVVEQTADVEPAKDSPAAAPTTKVPPVATAKPASWS